eukprot:1160240-Pelagomonas_calceolata.AAC.1
MLGLPELREAVAAHSLANQGIACDPASEVVITSGATEGIAACMLGLLNPGCDRSRGNRGQQRVLCNCWDSSTQGVGRMRCLLACTLREQRAGCLSTGYFALPAQNSAHAHSLQSLPAACRLTIRVPIHNCSDTLAAAGDEVIILDPCYDSYVGMAHRAGGVVKPLRLRSDDMSIPLADLEKAFGPKTKLIITAEEGGVGKAAGLLWALPPLKIWQRRGLHAAKGRRQLEDFLLFQPVSLFFVLLSVDRVRVGSLEAPPGSHSAQLVRRFW